MFQDFNETRDDLESGFFKSKDNEFMSLGNEFMSDPFAGEDPFTEGTVLFDSMVVKNLILSISQMTLSRMNIFPEIILEIQREIWVKLDQLSIPSMTMCLAE